MTRTLPVAKAARGVVRGIERRSQRVVVPRYVYPLILANELLRPAVDAVTLCSPIGLHYAQALQAIEAGKHVHFNKTMSTSSFSASSPLKSIRPSTPRTTWTSSVGLNWFSHSRTVVPGVTWSWESCGKYPHVIP